MKVKLFQTVVSVSPGGSGSNDFNILESEINNFFEIHPEIRVIDLKITSNAAPVGDILTNYGLIAMLMYDELA